jgi:hypothetical protein
MVGGVEHNANSSFAHSLMQCNAIMHERTSTVPGDGFLEVGRFLYCQIGKADPDTAVIYYQFS